MPPPDSSLSAPSLELPAGYRLEEYRILSKLGQGGFGITYLAEDTRMRVRVAIKELFPEEFATRGRSATVVPRRESDKTDFAWAKERFTDEAATLIRLTHPNIVRVFRFFEMNDTAYIVMEFVAGPNFKEWVKAHTQPDEATLKAVLFPLLDGLECVHRQGFLHRDISPENIKFTEDGRPLLIDFGNARKLEATHTIVIKHGFSPIEQYQTKAEKGPYTDLYALAGLMIYAITGAIPPFSTDRTSQSDPYRPLVKRYRGHYSESFLKALDWGFAIKAKDRPQTVADWRRRLTAKPPKPPVPPPKKRVWPAILLSLGVIALISAAAVWFSAPHHRRITVPDDYRTIQAAINAAKPDDTVYVRAGTYNEALKFKEGITLEGENPETTSIQYWAPPTATSGQDLLYSPLEIRNCGSGTISNLTFRQNQPDHRIWSAQVWKIDAITIWNSNVTVKNCRATSLADYGIGIYESSTVSLIGNRCQSSAKGGIYFGIHSEGWAKDNLVEKNDEDGIDVCGASTDLDNNRCLANREDGILFYNGATGKAAGNSCIGNDNFGIQVIDAGTEVELTENDCSSNQYSGIAFSREARGKAVQNVCRENSQNGISVTQGSPVLTENQLVKNTGYGIAADADSNPTYSANHFEDNIKGDVGRIPRRLGEVPTPSPTPEPTPARIVVPDQYKTIQAAINAAKPGDTVYVRHGTYNEALKFKEGITLQGEDPENTIVRYFTPATATWDQSQYDSPLEVRDCKTGSVLNLTFRQEQPDAREGDNAWKADAVTIFHSSITIKNCRAISAAAVGMAVYGSSTVTLIGNQCRSCAGSGITLYSGSNGTLEGNVCEKNSVDGIRVHGGGGPVDLEKNVCASNGFDGISFDTGAQGKAILNDCRENKWNGISLSDASPSLTSNVLTKNSRYGIWYDSKASPLMLGNQFDSNAWGAVFQAQPSPTPSPKPTPDPSTFGSPFGPMTLPSPFSFATPTPTPSPKPGPNDWLRYLFSPSPSPATGLHTK